MELADQGREDVGAFQVEVIVGAIEVGGHGRDEVAAVLLPVGLAELDAGDLGDGVGLVGRLQIAAEQVFLPHGLGAFPGVDAGTAQVEELFDVVEIGGVDHGGVDHHVVVDEFSRPGGVGPDAADGPGHQEDIFGPVGLEPVVDGRLVAQVELVPGGGQEVGVAFFGQAAQDGRADEAAVAGDVDPVVFFHKKLRIMGLE